MKIKVKREEVIFAIFLLADLLFSFTMYYRMPHTPYVLIGCGITILIGRMEGNLAKKYNNTICGKLIFIFLMITAVVIGFEFRFGFFAEKGSIRPLMIEIMLSAIDLVTEHFALWLYGKRRVLK